jgi:hypothetical protein
MDTAFLRIQAALLAEIELVVADLGGGGLVLHDGRRVFALDVGKGVRGARIADQQRIALRVVARAPARGLMRTRPR